MTPGSRSPAPVDHVQRERILGDLETNMLVEAAAGTGKTTCMLGRMIALLGSGTCAGIRHMAAVTFTRKAAAELRGRFQVGLEKAVRAAAGAQERENLDRALGEVEQCFIGTIHSFCARLLRERPVEAGVDLDFRETDEEEDRGLRQEAWELFAARVLAREEEGELAGLAEDLERIGLGLGDLGEAFVERFADYPDVDDWPVPEAGPLQGLDEAAGRLEAYAAHMRRLGPSLPRGDWGSDRLIWEYIDIPRRVAFCEDLRHPPALMEILQRFSKEAKPTQKVWKRDGRFTREAVKQEEALWAEFRQEVSDPLLRSWYELRYATVIRVFREARRVYDGLRQERGLLTYQDLLMKAAALLRDRPAVRAYFRNRFRFLLVDEFQDTDPVQAEVMLLLTADDPEENAWRQCRPVPGSLFVVGDPKQSIYRFRRADIQTYNDVREIIQRGDGRGRPGCVVELCANFRTSPPLIDWVNAVFGPEAAQVDPGRTDAPKQGSAPVLRFPAAASDVSPGYVPLAAGRVDGNSGHLSGVYRLPVPAEAGKSEGAAAYEADRIARTVRRALDLGWTVPRSQRDLEEGVPVELRPSDFLIVTRNRERMSTYARGLQAYGIPHQVTGGSVLNEVRELGMLHACLRAVAHPEDPVALLAVLRGELFGFSDPELFAFRKAGGRFCYHTEVPRAVFGAGRNEETVGEGFSNSFEDAFRRLWRYERWLDRVPPVAALERILEDLGLYALAGSRSGGDVEAGSLAKALEVLRALDGGTWSTAQVAEALGRLAESAQRHDGVSARSAERDEVRIMNLHKVKGLEAAVVFLADPSGESSHSVALHIDRAGDRVRGYMGVHAPKRGQRAPVLAQPEGWEALQERESCFASAEALRLRYVAATRAGSALIVCQRTGKGGRNRHNPWKYFLEHIPESRELPDPGPVDPPAGRALRVEPDEVERAAGAIAARRERMFRPSLAVAGAKAHALAQQDAAEVTAGGGEREAVPADVPAAPAAGLFGEAAALRAPVPEPRLRVSGVPEEGEHGVEWGTVIHNLLEAAMANPGADLDRVARAMLPEHGLDADRAGAAVETVRDVMRSGLWQRALRSPERFVEIPFEIERAEGGGPPTLIRGSIDLVFRETGGWVLVDWKTDRLRGGDAQALAAYYAPQVRLYAEAWESATGERPRETALYFVREDLYLPV